VSIHDELCTIREILYLEVHSKSTSEGQNERVIEKEGMDPHPL